jgi:hypothetical protein
MPGSSNSSYIDHNLHDLLVPLRKLWASIYSSSITSLHALLFPPQHQLWEALHALGSNLWWDFLHLNVMQFQTSVAVYSAFYFTPILVHPVLTTARFKLQCDWRVWSGASDKVTALDEASSTPSAMDKRGLSHFTRGIKWQMLCKRDISTSTCSELQTIRLPFCHKLILDFQFSSLLQISH